ncbi:MAG: hemolysin XhlA family protein [Terrisporobacter othiniensis]|uniref:hemolysin XhlA family protein n=1 Tax=Terrisporobacter othiniensis TaxID=1577792 RepID=UPI002A751E25|nr:hemolysin XhlA family protein [Terrisporobacter othiniensis]MDY3372364.1 hemolysin XhlA family protein [Terrisporobacter othiniensis]
MYDNPLQEVRERLIKIEVLLENISQNNDLKLETVEEKIKVANNRISDLENSNTWLWRAIVGALISSAIAFLLK